MKRKIKAVPLLIVLSMLFSLTGCGKQASTGAVLTEGSTSADLDGKTLAAFGTPIPEAEFEAMMNERIGGTLKDLQIVPSPGEMAQLIQNGQADAGTTLAYNAKYIVSRNPDLTFFTTVIDLECSMVFKKDSGLKEQVDAALTELESTGVLPELIETWLSDEALQQDPQPRELEQIPGAETIRVGISGTLPPMDYATADGKPGGFNVALFGEVSRLMGKNVEFVTIDPDAKFMALSSGIIDLFFWNFYGRFLSEDYEISEPYLSDYGAFLIRSASD